MRKTNPFTKQRLKPQVSAAFSSVSILIDAYCVDVRARMRLTRTEGTQNTELSIKMGNPSLDFLPLALLFFFLCLSLCVSLCASSSQTDRRKIHDAGPPRLISSALPSRALGLSAETMEVGMSKDSSKCYCGLCGERSFLHSHRSGSRHHSLPSSFKGCVACS